MSTTSLYTPTPLAATHAARGAALWFERLQQVLHLGRQVQAARRVRAQRIAEAAAVRDYAESVRAVDARFAADLWAAADRHDSSL
ncbi:MAG: hypothetical protein KGL78_00270 [Burkholderiales bacterium]|nr:hypothetical protein [Burkholderiales bacterium]